MFISNETQRLLSVKTSTAPFRAAAKTMLTFGKSRRARIILHLGYLFAVLDFLLHYVLAVELGLFQQIHQAFGGTSHSNASVISLCELPIRKYLPFSLSQMSLYIFYLSMFTLALSVEALRKSSVSLYHCYVMIKFISSIASLILGTTYTLVNRKNSFLQTSLILPDTRNQSTTLLTIETCLVYAREKLAIYLLAILNVFLFWMSMECSKIFSLLKTKSVI